MRHNNPAPVALFVYNRPNHTRQALESLLKNGLSKDTVLYVFADGAKNDASPDDRKRIADTRQVVRDLHGFKEVIIAEKDQNQGLAASVINGVTEVLKNHGRIIVLEDDLVVSPFFLEYMNEGLEMYEHSANVYSVNGFMFPLKYQSNGVVLLPYTSTWGWATWKNKWQVFDERMTGKELLLENKKLAARFNLGDYSYTSMLGLKDNSWGIKWYYSVFSHNGLNLFPRTSLVMNIGFDGSGTNHEENPRLMQQLSETRIDLQLVEKTDQRFYKLYVNYFRQNPAKKMIRKTISYFKK